MTPPIVPAESGQAGNGVRPYLERLYRLGIHLAFLSFSENSLQLNIQHSKYGCDEPETGCAQADTTANNLRLPYHESPTYSEAAARAFGTWLRAVGASPEFVGLPVLPQHYQAAVAAGNPHLERTQAVNADSPLWRYWTIWRRAIFNEAIGKLAAEARAVHAALPYSRAPLTVMLYQYPAWPRSTGRSSRSTHRAGDRFGPMGTPRSPGRSSSIPGPISSSPISSRRARSTTSSGRTSG